MWKELKIEVSFSIYIDIKNMADSVWGAFCHKWN